MKSTLKIAFIVTVFNLLLEYSLRGIADIQTIPLLPLALFLNYFPFFFVMEALVVKYRLRDYQLALASLVYGLIWMLFGPSVIYFPPLLFGLNWQRLIFVNFFWWVPIQTLLGFYIANRISPRKTDGKPISNRLIITFTIIFIFATLIFRFAVVSFPFVPLGIFVLLVLIFLTYKVFLKSLAGFASQTRPELRFAKDKFLDILSVFIILYCIYSAVLFKQDSAQVYVTHLNPAALKLGVKVTTVVTIAMLIHRFRIKKSLPI